MLSRKTKQLMMDNTVCRADRLSSGGELTLSELVHISDQQERDVMAYVMAQSEVRFNKLMRVIGPRWREYTELKLNNRRRMRELAEKANGHS